MTSVSATSSEDYSPLPYANVADLVRPRADAAPDRIAIVEVDEDTAAYDAGHIPGAVALHWQQELHSPPQRDFVSAAELAFLLGGKGIATNGRASRMGGFPPKCLAGADRKRRPLIHKRCRSPELA